LLPGDELAQYDSPIHNSRSLADYTGRFGRALVAVCLLCVFLATAVRAESIDYTLYMHWTGMVSGDGAGTYRDGVIEGDRLYAARFEAGLQILSLADPDHPAVLGEFATLGDAAEVVVSWPYAYVAATTGGLQVVDVSDPSDPQPHGTGVMPASANGLVIDGGLAFVACADSGLVVVDINNPAAPTVLERIDTPGLATRVALVGDHLAVADGIGGIQILSRSPYEIVESVATPGMAMSVCASGDHLYVADFTAGLTIIDISTITAPEVVSSIVSPPGVIDVAVVDTIAVLASSFAGIVTMDVSDPTAPARISGLSSSFFANGIVLGSDHAYLLDSQDLHVYTFGNGDTSPVSDYVELTAPVAAAANRHYLYVIDHSRLWVISVATGDTIGIGSNFYDPHDIILNGDYAYIADHTTGLRVADISVSSDPDVGGSTYLGGDAWSVVQKDDHLYVAVDGLGLATLSLEDDPGDPVLSGLCATGGTPRDIAVQGDVAYIAAGPAGLVSVDITDPAAPVVLDEMFMSQAIHHVAVSGEYAYGINDRTLEVFDVSDPGNITPVSSLGLRGPLCGIEVAGNIVYVVDPYIGLYVIDITHPESPLVIGGSIASSYFVSSLTLSDDRLYVVDGEGVFLMPKHGTPTNVEQPPRPRNTLSVSPNPFNPRTTITFSLAEAGDVNVGVYDLVGRRVTVLANRRFSVGDHVLQWDGRDAAGRALPTGVYLARMKSMDGVRSEKMTLVR
jgi:hypothetical protein